LYVVFLEILQQRSWEHWNIKKNKNARHAIFYQTISFCLQSRCAYRDNDDVFSYIEKLQKEINYFDTDRPIFNFCTFDDIDRYLEREISSTCRKFPKEWTVIQLCKNYNPVTLSSKYEEIVNYNTGISMTIFKHSAISEMLMLEIKTKAYSNENVFEKVFKLNRKINEELNYHAMPQSTEIERKESLTRYHRTAKEIDMYLQDLTEKIKGFFGPWIGALTGKFKNRKSIETENLIAKRVCDFLKERNFSKQQEMLIYLLARRLDLISNEQILLATAYILRNKPNLGYNDLELNDIYDLMLWIKQEYVYEDIQTYPVILIVDELLDQFPFETINTDQEFTRVCSFENLKKLYNQYSSSIENGYLYMKVRSNSCNAIINPDGSLKSMEERMKNFFSYWLPTWNIKCNQKPTKEEYQELLYKSDVLFYAGHGSGLHLLAADNVYGLKSKSVVFLFGCGSVALTSVGLYSELKGAHSFYHIGGSPACIGFLWTVTDFQTDLCSTKILSSWLNSSFPKEHWQQIDAALWRKNGTMSKYFHTFNFDKKLY
jgi:separase